MSQQQRDPADVSTWLNGRRSPELAAAIASAWRTYPDLPFSEPLAARAARARERIAALRPIHEAAQAALERDRRRANFAFTERQVATGGGRDRELAILRARDSHGYDWDEAIQFADGWCAAHYGLAHRYANQQSGQGRDRRSLDAYERGFLDGGGDRTDLFDEARRQNQVHLRTSNQPREGAAYPHNVSRPRAVTWPKPSDKPRPVSWHRRLAILSHRDIGAESGGLGWDFLKLLRAYPGSDDATVIIFNGDGFELASDERRERAGRTDDSGRGSAADTQLRTLLMGREFEDILLALRDDEIRRLDHALAAIPLARTMERTRNSRIQRRSHMRTWLDRGRDGHDNIGAGHIRWSNVIGGLTGRLGEFTAAYAGPATPRGHRVRVTTRDGHTAFGFADAQGHSLSPDIVLPSKARLRAGMTDILRAFAAATRLMGQASGPDADDSRWARIGVAAESPSARCG